MFATNLPEAQLTNLHYSQEFVIAETSYAHLCQVSLIKGS